MAASSSATVPARTAISDLPARCRGMPQNSTVTCPPLSTVSPSLLEEKLLGRAPQEPIAFLVGQELELLADQIDAIGILVIDNLKWAIALPHAPLGAKRFDDLLNERRQISIWRLLLAQRVE